jgi:hypothetical protein
VSGAPRLLVTAAATAALLPAACTGGGERELKGYLLLSTVYSYLLSTLLSTNAGMDRRGEGEREMRGAAHLLAAAAAAALLPAAAAPSASRPPLPLPLPPSCPASRAEGRLGGGEAGGGKREGGGEEMRGAPHLLARRCCRAPAPWLTLTVAARPAPPALPVRGGGRSRQHV